jgi:hypothetical protein
MTGGPMMKLFPDCFECWVSSMHFRRPCRSQSFSCMYCGYIHFVRPDMYTYMQDMGSILRVLQHEMKPTVATS